MSDLHITWIPREEIVKRYSRIKPVLESSGELYWLKDFSEEEIFRTSYIWNNNIGVAVKKGEIVPIPDKDFMCLHRYTCPCLFKPTIAEVLTQISPDIVDKVVAFEIIKSPETGDSSYGKDEFTIEAFCAGYHTSKIRLYRAP